MIVLKVGGMHLHSQQRTFGIGEDMTLAPLDPLGHVKPAWTTTFRSFHTLAVDHPSRGSASASLSFTHSSDQSAVDRTPQAGAAPLVEIILNRRTRREVFRQCAPLAAAGRNVEDRIHDHSQTDLAGTTAPASQGHQRLDQSPLRIRHVACITQSIAPILLSGDFSPTHVVLPSSLRKHEGITTDWNHSTFFFGQALRSRARAASRRMTRRQCNRSSFETRPRGRSSG